MKNRSLTSIPTLARIGREQPTLIEIRPVGPDDGPAIDAMAARCSPESLYHRFFAPVRAIPPSHRREVLSGRADRDSLVALDGHGRVIALATCATARTGDVELGVLVEDAWQRRGVARRLVRPLIERAVARGATDLQVVVQAEQGRLVEALGRLGPVARHLDGPTIDARVALSA